eukprot:3555297-Amphidinium_carterae.2
MIIVAIVFGTIFGMSSDSIPQTKQEPHKPDLQCRFQDYLRPTTLAATIVNSLMISFEIVEISLKYSSFREFARMVNIRRLQNHANGTKHVLPKSLRRG